MPLLEIAVAVLWALCGATNWIEVNHRFGWWTAGVPREVAVLFCTFLLGPITWIVYWRHELSRL